MTARLLVESLPWSRDDHVALSGDYGRPIMGSLRHAAYGIVDLMGLIHHGHMTCVWSVGTCPPRRRRDRGLIRNKKLQCRMTYISIASATLCSVGASGLATYKKC